MKISALDHLVLTVADIDRTIAFYTQVLGMEEVSFGNNRKLCCLAVRKSTYTGAVRKFSLTRNTPPAAQRIYAC